MAEILLAEMKVKDVYQLIVKEPSSVRAGTSLQEVLQSIIADHKTRHVYVLDKEDHLVGSIKMSGVIEYMFPHSSFGTAVNLSRESLAQFQSSLVAMDVMNQAPSFVTTETLLPRVVKIMRDKNIGELPVVNSSKQLVGEVNIHEIITSYLEHGEKREDAV